MDLSWLGDDPLFNGALGILVIIILYMLLTRKPKGPGGRR